MGEHTGCWPHAVYFGISDLYSIYLQTPSCPALETLVHMSCCLPPAGERKPKVPWKLSLVHSSLPIPLERSVSPDPSWFIFQATLSEPEGHLQSLLLVVPNCLPFNHRVFRGGDGKAEVPSTCQCP